MYTIYHNPRCSKSRQTLQILEENNKEVRIIEYLKKPLDEAEINRLLELLNVSPIEMMRTKEAEFKEQNLKGASNQELIKAMANTPKLIERPIITSSTAAVIGRPPENVLTLF